MIMNTDRGKDALELFDRKILSDSTARGANGFDDNDAPQTADIKDQATEAVMAMIEANPSLLQFPGADVLFRQVTAVLNGNPLGAQDYNGEVQQDEQQQAAEGIPNAPAISKSPMPAQHVVNNRVINENGRPQPDGAMPAGPTTSGPPAFSRDLATGLRTLDPAKLGISGTYSRGTTMNVTHGAAATGADPESVVD
jgi:hypothetical protein